MIERRPRFRKAGVETLFIPRIGVFGERSTSRSAAVVGLVSEKIAFNAWLLMHGFVDFVFQHVELGVEPDEIRVVIEQRAGFGNWGLEYGRSRFCLSTRLSLFVENIA
jgi:hypothetical protein